MFNEGKTAQMAAYFLLLCGNRMPHLKLMKLLYLSDRKAMNEYGFPISGDKFVSMDYGPVLSTTLNLINGWIKPKDNGWESWVTDKENHHVALKDGITRDNLDELSEADIQIMDSVWNTFKNYNQWRIAEYTHTHCSEWKDPKGSLIPISYHEIFKALGKSNEEAQFLSERIEEESYIEDVFAQL
ncbi:MAG: Panacea domain-containing protein [Mariprofundaceae bacterium]|nr:Panacea domain-containing protein [Mariprofundaceae bacterium]